MTYKAAVITVSDKGSRGERVDEAGPAVAELLTNAGFDVTYRAIVPDERADIGRELIKCADELDIPLVVTTGGTGFSPRDITPESTLAVVERRAAGIPEAMRYESLKITNRAMLSRCEAGIRGGTLIVNLPGSTKAARENLAAVVDALAHGLQMLREPQRDHG
ncbi:MAG: MogA/MoaB family molybdenum cofactor biosynthesis protein [Oscillospiraceae bacterium]|jgi:molybdenum cofactor synthesis domain-containing protein|nr:MogA/MoaB family molybdenum cofactor biosynthesis protein [Oscillospiraceae bacterium]